MSPRSSSRDSPRSIISGIRVQPDLLPGCHGPGSAHVANPSRANIVNPARLDPVHANDVCIQCHSQGQPLKNPIEGRHYDWPVGFHVAATTNLRDFWRLDEPELGKQDFLYYADGTAHKNRMHGNDFVTSRMYLRGVTCFNCHDVHGTTNNADLRMPVSNASRATGARSRRRSATSWSAATRCGSSLPARPSA